MFRQVKALVEYAEPLIPALILIILAAPIIPAYGDPLFDETWYISAARKFLSSGVYERVEHPPLGQLLISTGILLLGDNPIGWRILSLIFASSSLILVYLISKELTRSRILALTSSVLLASEKMFFTFSTLGVLDIFFITFSLLSVYSALKGHIISSALTIAAGLCCKLTAILFAPVTLLIIIARRPNSLALSKSKRGRILGMIKWLTLSVASFLIFLYVFDGLYSAVEGIEETVIRNPIRHISYMIGVHASGNWPSGYGEPPWTWIIQPRNYYLSEVSLIRKGYFETLNPLIYGLTFISIPYTLWRSIKTRNLNSIISLTWFAFTYLIWIPLYFIASRPLFSFYLLPTIPIICVTVVYFIDGDRRTQYLLAISNLIFFLMFQYPIRMVIHI